MRERRFPHEELLAGTEWLEEHGEDADLRLVEVTASSTGYALRHIPGAVYLGLDKILTGRVSDVPLSLGPIEEVSAVLGELGLTIEDRIVVYDDDGGVRAAQGFWLLEYLGCERVRFLEGGKERWLAEGRATSRERPDVEPSRFVPALKEERMATAEWILAHLEDDEVCLLDTRSPREYRSSRIPGAHHRPWDESRVRRGYPAYRPAEELRADFAAAGATEDKEIVTYCGSGARSAHTYLALRLLGFPRVRNYDGSWNEWGARADLPKG